MGDPIESLQIKGLLNRPQVQVSLQQVSQGAIVVKTRPEVGLLIIPRSLTVFPVATTFFAVTQNPVRKMGDKYRDGLYIQRDGSIRRIQAIHDRGLYGNTFLRKLRSALFGTRSIEVVFDHPDANNLEDIKQLLANCLENDSELVEPFLPQSKDLPQVKMRLLGDVKQPKDIFDVLDLPPIEDCLDVM